MIQSDLWFHQGDRYHLKGIKKMTETTNINGNTFVLKRTLLLDLVIQSFYKKQKPQVGMH